MGSLNKVQLIGRIGNEPEIREFDNGGKVASFSLATSEKYKNKSGEKVENTEWHNISVFGKKASLVEMFLEKGKEIYIEGALKTRSWEKDGAKHYRTEIVLNDFNSNLVLIGAKGGGVPSEEPKQKGVDDSDDFPF